MSTPTDRRQRLRHILQGSLCIHPASVFDPISARLAESAGFEVGLLPGSIAAATILGVPDIVLLTLPEFAEQTRRITRYSDLSLLADADHGYGNALNVQRAVEELETAGAAAITLEDTLLPAQFGRPGEEMVPLAEMLGKLKAALAARRDPSLVIVGRTNALRSSNLADCIARLKAYQEAGADAVMVVGLKAQSDLEALGKALSAPIVLGSVAANTPAPLTDVKALAANGVRIAFQGHYAFMAAVKAMQEVLQQLRAGASAADLKSKIADDPFFNQLIHRADYIDRERRFLGHADGTSLRA